MFATDAIVTAVVTAPISSGTPATISSLLGAPALAAINGRAIAQIDIEADTIPIHVRDSSDVANRADDYVISPVSLASTSALNAYVISSGAAAKARLLIHCHRSASV